MYQSAIGYSWSGISSSQIAMPSSNMKLCSVSVFIVLAALATLSLSHPHPCAPPESAESPGLPGPPGPAGIPGPVGLVGTPGKRSPKRRCSQLFADVDRNVTRDREQMANISATHSEAYIIHRIIHCHPFVPELTQLWILIPPHH